METAVLAGGCFWCLEAAFEQLSGVQEVQSGYANGSVEHPTYEQVCTGRTGHAEVVRITFDPAELTFPELLEVFFAIHDPTTLNRQGEDVGTQYRSGIYTQSEQQLAEAREAVESIEKAGIWPDPIVTEIEPLQSFYPAEEYHRRYFQLHPEQGYCRAVISPKVNKLRQKFAHRLRKH